MADEATANCVIVSCPASLFESIKSLVEQLDVAASPSGPQTPDGLNTMSSRHRFGTMFPQELFPRYPASRGILSRP